MTVFLAHADSSQVKQINEDLNQRREVKKVERSFGLGILELRGDSDGLISAKVMAAEWRFWLELRLTCSDCAAVNLPAPARLHETLL